MKTIRALGLVAVLAFGSAVGAFAQGKRPADVAKEADVAKDVRRDIGGESNGNWGWIGLLGLAGLAGLLGRYRDGANRSGTIPRPLINHPKRETVASLPGPIRRSLGRNRENRLGTRSMPPSWPPTRRTA